jgi:hypothetical protein
VLGIARRAEVNTTTKRGRKRARTPAIDLEIDDDKDEVLEIMRSDSETDCIIVANSRAMSIEESPDDDDFHSGYARRPYEPSLTSA